MLEKFEMRIFYIVIILYLYISTCGEHSWALNVKKGQNTKVYGKLGANMYIGTNWHLPLLRKKIQHLAPILKLIRKMPLF